MSGSQSDDIRIWCYASLSVIIISACGLFGVVVIPFMQKHFYHQLLQFLVALAIGTLCGDALLHLLPHAMMSHHHSGPPATNGQFERHMEEPNEHNANVWKGFVAMLGIIFFYFVEKFLTLGAEWRKRRQKKHKLPTRVRVMRDEHNDPNNVGEKLCKHKYSSYPYCYDEIATDTTDDHHNRRNTPNNLQRKSGASGSGIGSTTKKARTTFSEWDETNTTDIDVTEPTEIDLSEYELALSSKRTVETNQNNIDVQSKNKRVHNGADLPKTDLQLGEEESYTVILRSNPDGEQIKDPDIPISEKSQDKRIQRHIFQAYSPRQFSNIVHSVESHHHHFRSTMPTGSYLELPLRTEDDPPLKYIVREHESQHHGHSHTHGHVHSAPDSLSSVAWMVIMGDGLHNFTDGMAIGAAFATGLAGGFSTSVAVFCHELPHEIGDFAVLLKAGMSAKQAIFYNILSSILCFFGCVLGLAIGHIDVANDWVFAAAAGMFIYIALVDMIPELTSSHSNEGGSLLQCLLQFLGLMSGLGVMLVIALYEETIKGMFGE